MSKFKLINTGNTDQFIPLAYGSRPAGVVGSAANLPGRLTVPGLAKVEEGKNFVIVDESQLRVIFGLYETGKPGVLDPKKPTPIIPANVKRNSRLLDSGRMIVTDEFGNHILGIGGQAYQKNALDNLKTENELLTEKISALKQVLVNDGFTEEQAQAIIDGKTDKVQEILKQKEIGTRGKGMENPAAPVLDPDITPPKGFVDIAKEVFADRETVAVFCGDEVVQEYKVKSMKNAIERIEKLAAEQGCDIGEDLVTGLPTFTDAEGRVVRLG